MDSHNLFMTPTTYRCMRLEYAGALAVASILLLLHIQQVRWLPFVVLFAYIDVIGYLPGAIAWRRRHGELKSRVFHILYNTTHNFVSAGAVAAVWTLARGPEWALLALPIHLCGDRAIFGNFVKPFGLSFEPQTHPAYKEFASRYDSAINTQSNYEERAAARAAA